MSKASAQGRLNMSPTADYITAEVDRFKAQGPAIGVGATIEALNSSGDPVLRDSPDLYEYRVTIDSDRGLSTTLTVPASDGDTVDQIREYYYRDVFQDILARSQQ